MVMEQFLQNMLWSDVAGGVGGIETVVLMFLLTFCIGHIVAWVYMLTHTGLSYSQMFAAALVVLPMLVALTMALVSDNIYVALGLFSVFAMIRFRNVLKDTRDTAFVLWAVVEGVAIGTQRFGLGVTGAVCIGLVFLYTRVTSFGGRHRYDVVISLEWAGAGNFAEVLRPVFRKHALRAQLASQHDVEQDKLDVSYRLLLRDPGRSRELVSELQTTRGIGRVTLFHRSDEAEV
jgi:hypothetical protein